MKVILLRRKEAASTQHGKKASTQSADCCIVTMSSGGLALQVFQFRFILNPKPSDAGSRGSDWSLWVVSFGPGLGARGFPSTLSGTSAWEGSKQAPEMVILRSGAPAL